MTNLVGVYNNENTIVRKAGEGYKVTIIYLRSNAMIVRKEKDLVVKEKWMSAEQVEKLIRNYK